MAETSFDRDRSHSSSTSSAAVSSFTSSPEHPAHREGPIAQAAQRIWRKLHLRFPNLFRSPDREEREYLRHRDAEDNLASRVPSDERLRQVALWGVEVFGPAEADRLYSAITRLGWNDERLFGLNTDPPGSWIGEQRTYGIEGSLNLGVIERPGKSRFLPRGRHAQLPDAVDYAHGWVYQLSPSVTAICICFVLTDVASNAYQAEINLDRKTVHKPREGGYRSYNVEHAKRRAVDVARIKLRAVVTEWFAENLPGLFSVASDGSRLPTAELLTTLNQSLLDAKRTRIEPDWIQLATPRGHSEVWTLKSFEGLKLCWPNFEGDLRYHGVVNLQVGLLTAEHLKYRGDPCDAVHAAFVDDHVRGILVNFAAIAALREITRHLRITPGILSADTASRKGTVKTLERIRVFFDDSVGVPAFTSELAAKSEHVHSYRWDCSEFQKIPLRPDEQPIQIAESLRSRTHYLASRACSLERETREQLEQISAILSTRENIRTQARMELVTVGVAIVSIVSLAVAVMSVDRFASYINRQVERLYTPE